MLRMILALALVVSATPLAAQQHEHDPDEHVAGGGELPDGWHARLDKADASLSAVQFTRAGDDLHVKVGPAAIYYDPTNTMEGSYRTSATFVQAEPSRHPEGYGLFVGGQNLEGENQDYLYFLVRQDGSYLIKHRAGSETHVIEDWTEHTAVAQPGTGGAATNTLSVEAGPRRVRFLINGEEVASYADVPMMNTTGIAGLRVNHNLDLRIENFEVEPITEP